MKKHKEYSSLDLSKIGEEILSFWNNNSVFDKSIADPLRPENFTFYEGPPSANGMPGIHHVIARTCLLYTSPSPRDRQKSRMPSSA